jgi:hypothetical protein
VARLSDDFDGPLPDEVEAMLRRTVEEAKRRAAGK